MVTGLAKPTAPALAHTGRAPCVSQSGLPSAHTRRLEPQCSLLIITENLLDSAGLDLSVERAQREAGAHGAAGEGPREQDTAEP